MAYINKSKSNCWGTPKGLYAKLDAIHGFDYDPCPFPRPDGFDGLSVEWRKSNFVNPPYSNIEPWAEKCRIEQMRGNKSVFLIPARTDTKYFHKWILPFAKIEFIKGRLKFVDLDNSSKKTSSSPFPSIICVYEAETFKEKRKRLEMNGKGR